MINHARTLLLNIPGPVTERADLPGAYYIPPFAQVQDTSELRRVDACLFVTDGSEPSRAVRAAQYLKLLHLSPYRAYAVASDARLTYDPGALLVFDELQSAGESSPTVDMGAVVTAVSELPEATLSVLFGDDSSRAEPFTTFFNMFMSGTDLPTRLIGIVLALIYRREELGRG